MILFIDACVRKDSRTRRLAERVLSHLNGPVETVRPIGIAFPKTDEAFLKKRDACIAAGDFSDPAFDLAKQFVRADTVVIAAPHWDLSFPAALKQYFEQINVVGLTFYYTDSDRPVTLCRAKKLVYVATAGGPVRSHAYGFGYVKGLGEEFYGITDAALFCAEGIDLFGADAEAILRETEQKIDRAFS
ncbi:MAG: NAD(P)H-dependent oxidoreductase [Clostridia bacterium]|nr:NAD(P)H-dependent oxidoreductase [Clostridia bacterium]